MCDYSLCGLPNRLALEGEELVSYRFRTGSIGLASPLDLIAARPSPSSRPQTFWQQIKRLLEGDTPSHPITAVCIPPGAQLLLKNIPADLQRHWQIAAEESAFFVQTSHNVNSYRDAVQFYNGKQALLQNLREGIRVEVLSLGAAVADEEREREDQRAVPAL
jgi:hypothetical protein